MSHSIAFLSESQAKDMACHSPVLRLSARSYYLRIWKSGGKISKSKNKSFFLEIYWLKSELKTKSLL